MAVKETLPQPHWLERAGLTLGKPVCVCVCVCVCVSVRKREKDQDY